MPPNEIVLAGCTPTPLASYLKALGVFRLVAEQKDPGAEAHWQGEHFALLTRLSRDELMRFFLAEYRPTPILAPWNGGSGFYPNDNKDGFAPISTSTAARLLPLREAIETGSTVLSDLGLSAKPEKDGKARLLLALRSRAGEEFLSWLDAAVVLVSGDPSYPPLLGTGGNDGRLDFTNNFLQRLTELMDVSSGTPIGLSEAWLENALGGAPSPKLSQKAIGQFAPGQVGGANATTGFSIDSRMNPWDFVLMLEGTLLFVTSTSRRLESSQQGALSYPFTVHASGAGCGGVAQADAGNARGEMWMPLWTRAASLPELETLLTEGRATFGRRAARDGLDFARAVSRLGVDRGVSSFQRYGFLVRNGLAYLATPISRVESRREPSADLIDDLERGQLLDSLRRQARTKEAPASLKRTVSQLVNALFALTRPGAGKAAIQRALILLGEVMQTLAVSRKGQDSIRALPSLSSAWVTRANDDSPEFRIALALCTIPGIARYLAPVAWNRRARRWEWQPESRTHVWANGDLEHNLARVVARRLIDFERLQGKRKLLDADAGTRNLEPGPFDADAALGARIRDLEPFVSAETDDNRIAGLLQGLIWARPPEALSAATDATRLSGATGSTLPVAVRVLEPFFTSPGLLRYLERLPRGSRWSLPQEIPRQLAAGHVDKALALAWRRSRITGLGWPPDTHPPRAPRMSGARLLAALTVPMQAADLARLIPKAEEQAATEAASAT